MLFDTICFERQMGSEVGTQPTQSLGRYCWPFSQYIYRFLDQQYAIPFFMVMFSVEYHTLDAHCMHM